jgi:NADH-quinone oxidoreductase subunit G
VRRTPLEAVKKRNIPEWNDEAARTAIQNDKGPLFIAAPCGTRLDDIAVQTYLAAPDDLARLGFAVAHALSENAPPVPGLSDDVRSLAHAIAEALRNAERPLVVSGTGCGSKAVLQAAANVAWALCTGNPKSGKNAELCLTVPECNSLGLALMDGRNIAEAFRLVQDEAVEAVIVLENDLFRRANRETVEKFLGGVSHCVLIDHLPNETTANADIILPAATFAEASGTLVNNEGRAQRFFRVFAPDDDVQESWKWLHDIMLAARLSEAERWKTLDDITAAMAEALPAFKAIVDVAPGAGYRMTGMKIPRQPHRYSGRTAMHAQSSVHEPQPPDDPDSPLSFSMEGYEGLPPSPLIARFWVPRWNSVQAASKYQKEVGGQLLGGDPGLRLIEPAQVGRAPYYPGVPEAFKPRDGEFLIVPLYHIFGSEELSARAQGVAELMPEPYLALNAEDAAKLSVHDEEEVELSLPHTTLTLTVKLRPDMPAGVGGLPAGLPKLQGIIVPDWGKVLGPGKGR